MTDDALLNRLSIRLMEAGQRLMRHPSDPRALADHRAAHAAYRQHALKINGIDCPVCGASGYVVTRRDVTGARSGPCDCCRGEGRVLKSDARDYLERHGLSLADAEDLIN